MHLIMCWILAGFLVMSFLEPGANCLSASLTKDKVSETNITLDADQDTSQSVDGNGQDTSQSVDGNGQDTSQSVDGNGQDTSQSVDDNGQDTSQSVDDNGQDTSQSVDGNGQDTSQSVDGNSQDTHQYVGIDAESNNTDITLELLTRFCPGANVCDKSSDISEVIEPVNYSSYCTACSCSEDCHASWTYCNPSPDHNTTKHNSCYSSLMPPLDDSESLGHQSYMMVDIEPFNSSTTSNASCGNTNVAPWGSLYPVYSKSSRKLYKNSVCAAAYGVTDFIQLNAFVGCIHPDLTVRGNLFSNTPWDGFAKKCDVSFVFPGDKAVLDELVCLKNIVSTCPETFHVNTEIPTDQLKAACDSDLLSPYKGTDRVMYKNVFCSACNDRYDENEMCPTREIRRRRKRGYVALLNMKASAYFTNSYRHENVKEACIFTAGLVAGDQCRPVLCPSTQIYNDEGVCVFMVNAWYNIRISVYLQLTSDVLLDTTDITRHSLTSEWFPTWQLTRLYYFPSNGSNHSTTSKLIVHIGKDFEVINPKEITSKVYILKNKLWKVQTANGSLHMKSDFMDAQDTYLPDVVKSQLRYIYTVNQRKQHIVINYMFYCDQVSLQKEEFSTDNFITIRNNLSGQFLLPGQYYFQDDKQSARACIEHSGLSRVLNGCPATSFTAYLVYISVVVALFYI